MPTKNKLQIVYKNVDDLIPYARNAKIHDENNINLIAGSIKSFGFNNPILLDGENGIIAGHGRVLASKKLGIKQIPTIELQGLSDAEKRAERSKPFQEALRLKPNVQSGIPFPIITRSASFITPSPFTSTNLTSPANA